jgi:hypothetical protein
VEPQTIDLATTQIDDEVCCRFTLSSTISKDDFTDLTNMLTRSTDMDSLDITNYAPSLTIAKSYINLNNGRIQIDPPYQINIYFPIHTEPITT